MRLFHFFLLLIFISKINAYEIKRAPVKGSEVYFSQISDDQVFILQKVSNISSPIYESWSQYGSEILSNFEVASSTISNRYFKDAQNSIDVFLKCLRLVKSLNVDVWVAFSVDSKLLQVGLTSESLLEHTEMSFAVVTSRGVPVVQHFGIVRNPLYQGEKHSAMSVKLHAFAAAVMRQLDEEKQYMINIPLAHMRGIIQQALPDNATAVGVNNEKSWITIDEEGDFYLKDYHKENVIFSLKPQGKEIENAWFYLMATGSSFTPENYFTVRLDLLAEAFRRDNSGKAG